MKYFRLKMYVLPISFGITLLFLLTLATYMQNRWGMGGLGLTELGLAVIAISGGLLFRYAHTPLSKVFIIKKVGVKGVIGSIVTWAGAFFAVSALALVTMSIFSGMSQRSEEIGAFISSDSLAVALLMVVLMPAVCEELLHRGLFLHCLSDFSVRSQVLASGVIFGVFHLDLYRFLTTALLGCCLAYCYIKTKNILVPMLLHAINNMLPLLASTYIAPATAEEQQPAQGSILYTMLIYALFSTSLLYLGLRMLRRSTTSRQV